MDKHILHSVLETLTVGSPVTLNFTEPFEGLSGDYSVLVSKVGRGRGGSRVIEVQSVSDPSDEFGALEIDGRERLLGTGTSEFISTVVVGGKTYGLEDPVKAPAPKPRKEATKRETKARTKTASKVSQSSRVAKVLGDILAENPTTSFKLVGMSKGSSLNGDWRVEDSHYDVSEGTLQMTLVDLDNPGRKLAFDSTVHGVDVKDAQVISVENGQ